MKKKEIQAQYLKKVGLLQKFNFNYYEKSQSLVDDQKYDILKKELPKNVVPAYDGMSFSF